MFAGLPGIGVGTLFYVLIALWMPLREIGPLVHGRSTIARWKLIAKQLVFSSGIIASVAAADRALLWSIGGSAPRAVGPARWINDRLGVSAPHTILAAPITASLLLLLLVLLLVQGARLVSRVVYGPPMPVPPNATLPSAPTPHASAALPSAESAALRASSDVSLAIK